MKYVIMFRYDDDSAGLIEVSETTTKPEILQGDFITLEKGEKYHVTNVLFNHDIYMNRVFVYVMARELNEEEKEFFDTVVG